jgi:hypothetical protein
VLCNYFSTGYYFLYNLFLLYRKIASLGTCETSLEWAILFKNIYCFLQVQVSTFHFLWYPRSCLWVNYRGSYHMDHREAGWSRWASSSGVNVTKLFSSLLKLGENKLECLCRALPRNIILGRKGWRWTYTSLLRTFVKYWRETLYDIDTWVQCYKTFLSVKIIDFRNKPVVFVIGKLFECSQTNTLAWHKNP